MMEVEDATETTDEDSSAGEDVVIAAAGTVGGDNVVTGQLIEEDALKTNTTITTNDKVDEESSSLERKVEAIDDEEAAITPTLQRNAPFSTPGAFRASPHCGVLRRVEGGTGGSSVTSMITSISRRVSSGGVVTSALPPIEAVLVENSLSVGDPQQQRRRRRRRAINNNNHEDDDDVFTAEPLASVKEFVSTTPRYIIIILAILCMVTVITGTVAIVVVKKQNSDENKEIFKNQTYYYSHHAIIFGSSIISTNESYPGGCQMEIRITCDAEESRLQVYENQIGEYAMCHGKPVGNFYEHYHCTIPYSRASYISFDCLTPYPVKARDTTATVKLYQQANSTCESSNSFANNNTNDGNDSLAFLRLVRICGPDLDNIITVYECEDENSGMTNAQLEVCTQSLYKLELEEYSNSNIIDHDVSSDCDENGSCPSSFLHVVDRSRCPMNDPPEQIELDSDDLEPMLIENVTALINLL